MDVATTWQEAFDYCKSQGARLTQIANKDENKKIVSYFNEKVPWVIEFWLGYKRFQGNKFYLQPQNKPLTYADWNLRQPDNWGGNENCVSVYIRTSDKKIFSKWNDQVCTFDLFFSCMKLKL